MSDSSEEYLFSDEEDNKHQQKKKSDREENPDLKIYPIKIDEDKLGEDKSFYPLPSTPHFNVFLGRIRSGKSVLIQNMYLSKKRFYGGAFDVRILISESAKNDTQQKNMIDEFDFFFEEYSETLLAEILSMIENDKEDRKYLLLIDDAMSEKGIRQNKYGRDAFTSMITRYRHIGSKILETEGRLCVGLCLQYYKFLTSTLRNQIQGFFLLGELPHSELKKIADDYSFMGGDEKEFIRLFNETRKEDWDFTYMNVPNMEMYRNFDDRVWSKKEKSNSNISNAEEESDRTETSESESESSVSQESQKRSKPRRVRNKKAKKKGPVSQGKGNKSTKKISPNKPSTARSGRKRNNRINRETSCKS
jgi:hypothetical protein